MTDVIGAASAGLADLAGAVTSVLGPAGPLEGLTHIVLDALRDVWEGFFGSPIPPGGTNWNAYTHEELYQMLRQDADVGDVSAVAAEWGRHATALAGDADALRDQLAALRSNWEGQAAEQATERLAELRERISGIGARADAVQRAAQDAADALALARQTMPPPPGGPTGFGLPGPGAPLDAVAVGGASMFQTNAFATGTKAEAVRVMQTYESGLQQSGHKIAPGPPGATEARAYRVDGLEGAGTSAAGFPGSGPLGGTPGGVPWSRLVGGGSLGHGVTAGIGQGALNPALIAERGVLSDLAARRPMGTAGGFFPGSAAQGAGDRDDDHHNRLPAGDHRLFTLDERACTPVIGASTDRE